MMHRLAPDLTQNARAALCARRYPRDLLARLDALSLEEIRDDPWVALFQGRRLCRLHSRFKEAAPLIADALGVFRARGDTEGELWALAEHVVMCYHGRDLQAGLTALEPALRRPMPVYLRSELYFGQFLCLIALERVRESLAAGEAALALLEQEPDAWLRLSGRIQMLRNMAAGYHYAGEGRRSIAAAQQALALVQEDEEAASALAWCSYELGIAYARQGRIADAMNVLGDARRQAEAGQHHELWRWAVAAQGHVLRDQGRLDAARAAYQLANNWGEDPEGPALMQIRQDQLAEARWSCEALAALHSGLWQAAAAPTMLALVDLKEGKPEAALLELERAIGVYEANGFVYYARTAQLYRAAAALALGQADAAAEGAAAYLQFAAREELLTCAWWVPELIEPVLTLALRRGIEPAWTSHFLTQRFAAQAAMPYIGGHEDEATELRIARQTQLSLLPDAPPAMPDLDIAASVVPAAHVGGDFVGYFPFGASPDASVSRHIGLALGDISGKGLTAALLLSGTVVALNTVAANGAGPAQVASALHAAMYPYTSRTRMNIAFCYTMLAQHAEGWRLWSVGCGAVPPLIRRASGEIVWLDTVGFPLGTLANDMYREVMDDLAPGDTLVLLSDGIVEAMDERRELFGFDRLSALLAEQPADTDAHGTIAAVLRAVREYSGAHEQQDDITIIVVRALAGARLDC